MLVLRHKESDEHVHVEKESHEARLCVRTVREPVDILDPQDWRALTTRENGHATIEPYIGLGDPAKQGLDEFIDFLARLTREISQARFECRVHGDVSCCCHRRSPFRFNRRTRRCRSVRTFAFVASPQSRFAVAPLREHTGVLARVKTS
jgi:hypothetical protein